MNDIRAISRLAVDDLVLAQTTSAIPVEALLNVGRHTGGLVLSDNPGIGQAAKLRKQGFALPLVLDLLGVDWRDESVAETKRHRVWHDAMGVDADLVVTPSRRIGPGDDVALGRHLEEALALLHAGAGNHPTVLLGLALDAQWLDESDYMDLLERRLHDFGSPAVVAFAAAFDPVGTRRRVRNFRRFVERLDVAVTRSDLAAVGAWAYGARFTSVGLSSTVRHLPVPMVNRSPRNDRTPHVLVPASLGWVKASELYFAGNHPSLRCSCPICGHRPLARLGDLRPQRHEEALLHSFHVWQRLAHHLAGAPAAERAAAWQRACKDALDAEDQLATDLGIEFSRQPLRSWVWL